MKVLMLSKTFPAWHPRRGEPTGFAEKFLSGVKIHTLRENAKGYYKDGDVVSVRQWSGTPYNSPQEVIKDGVRIGVVNVSVVRQVDSDLINVWLGRSIKMFQAETLAINDGLSVDDLAGWVFAGGKDKWNGFVIHFTDFRY